MKLNKAARRAALCAYKYVSESYLRASSML
jgi:hypothetical protein